tara:strand:- start:4586 stop:5596 length:1011 start_codon:yes stop_codon:yes gene_type:complete
MISTEGYILIFILIISFLFFYYHNSIAKYFKLFDYPDKKRKIHLKKVPITGGLGLFLVILFSIFFNFSFDEFERSFSEKLRHIIGFFLCMTIFFVTGLFDDKYKLSPIFKLLNCTIGLIVLISLNNQILISELYFLFIEKKIVLENFSYVFTIFCFLVFTQAINMFDGINLQSSLYSLTILIIFYILTKDFLFLSISMYLIIFLYFNSKSKMFLGDSGTYLLGFLISYFSIELFNYKFITTEKIFILMLFPGLDLTRLFIARLLNGKSPFLADKNHIHHIILKKVGFKFTILIFAFIYTMKFLLIFLSIDIIGILILFILYCFLIYYFKKNLIRNT